MKTLHAHSPKSDQGVSPIVSVILMIVVSVILASIVLGFALGLADTMLREPPSAGITISQNYHDNGADADSYSIVVVASSMPNADSVKVQGPTTSATLDDVGDHVEMTGLKTGDIVIVTAQKGDQTVVIRKYTVG